MTTAIVLGGGGTCGDFEVGALRYLYDQGIQPDIISCCSVGSINGAKLAEGESNTDPTQGLKGLEALWLDMQTNADMYVPEAWLDSLLDVKDALTNLERLAPPHELPALRELADQIAKNPQLLADRVMHLQYAVGRLITLVPDAVDALNKIGTARSLYNLVPIEQKLATCLDQTKISQWAATGKKLRMAVVSLDTGGLRYVTETGQLLERDNQTVVTKQSLAPPCQQLADTIGALEDQKRGLQADLVTAAPAEKPALIVQIQGLNAQIEQRKQDLQQCMVENPPVSSPLIVTIRAGARASAAVPAVFPPVKLGNETYVDGGVRETFPIQAAFDLDATTVWGIATSTSGLAPKGPFDKSTMFEILARSMVEIVLDEGQFNETHPAGGWGGQDVKIIQPRIDIHDSLTIDPGLIRISMAYGYMRAADVRNGASEQDEVVQLADQISLLRKDIWRLECLVHGKPVPTEPSTTTRSPDLTRLPEVRQKKLELDAKIARRSALGGAMPADAGTWRWKWEAHPWLPTETLWPWTVTAEPVDLPLGLPVQVTIRAVDVTTQTPVAGRIRVNNQEVGNTNTPFTTTFQLQGLEEANPVITVITPSHGTSNVYCRFYTPQLQLSVEPSPVPIRRPVQVTVRALDANTQQPVAGSVSLNGQIIGSTNMPFTYTLEPSGATATVVTAGYQDAIINLPPGPEPRLQVSMQPAPVPLGRTVQVTVRTVDADSLAVVAGTVKVDGQEVGSTNTSFPYTFQQRTEQVWDPDLRRYIPQLVDPSVTVSAVGYADVLVACTFYVPRLRVWAFPNPVPILLPMDITIRAVDDVTNQVVGGAIRIEGQVVGDNNMPFKYTMGRAAVTATVSAADYPNASVTLMPGPEPAMQVSIQPYPVEFDIERQYTVQAVDANSSSLIGGTVNMEAQVVGNTNTPFMYRFQMLIKQVFDPDLGEWIPEEYPPTATVSALPYPDTQIDLGVTGEAGSSGQPKIG
ncbi:MAG: patatin-like phospholipase family protein [Chloroflexi bacterium]|nr:patatin-like phospholipase family protein [Chloroflexota bacterium]MCI0578574.1 patatin-like phospholipase family protein [Chloroflexota bacterium]MCI0647333.1 patatin-like phospholipase family protein [Chloroflexota bacterium]MCI0727793.1 patatin-like phospholipase family protein [Chloroflexota bacterium]